VDVDRDGVPQNSERSGDSFGGLRASGRTARFHTATHHRSDRGESAPYPASACEHVVRAAAPNKGISGRSPAMTGSGAGPIRRRSPSAMRPVGARFTRSKLLDGYRGVVQCDGYAAYKKIAATAPEQGITLAFCWSHLRRQVFDIAKGGDAPIANEALERIAALYAIEKMIRGSSAEQRRAVRQERSKPLVVALRAWLEHQPGRVSGKALIADAIRYALHRWEELTRFLDDGRI
jgi:hypothetical protein